MSHIDQTNRTALLIGLGTIAIALALRWINVRGSGSGLPELLLAIIAMAAVVWDLAAR